MSLKIDGHMDNWERERELALTPKSIRTGTDWLWPESEGGDGRGKPLLVLSLVAAAWVSL